MDPYKCGAHGICPHDHLNRHWVNSGWLCLESEVVVRRRLSIIAWNLFLKYILYVEIIKSELNQALILNY